MARVYILIFILFILGGIGYGAYYIYNDTMQRMAVLRENNAKLEVSLFDSAVGSASNEKIAPINMGEMLRLNIGTAPIPGKVSKVKGADIEVTLRRPACLFEKSNVAISRRIADRWRLIGAGIIG